MGDDIGLGSWTGCRLWSLGDHWQQTEMYYVGYAKTKKNGTQTDVITQWLTNLISLDRYEWSFDFSPVLSLKNNDFNIKM